MPIKSLQGCDNVHFVGIFARHHRIYPSRTLVLAPNRHLRVPANKMRRLVAIKSRDFPG